MPPVLEVVGLSTEFRLRSGVVRAVQDVSFSVNAGETLAIVGESGCGKTITALSLIRLIPEPPGRIVAGTVRLAGVDLLRLDQAAMRRVRGRDIAMIFQEPMTALNPLLTIGRQIAEMVVRHEDLSRSAGRAKAIDMLRHVRMPEPERRARDYPHQLSGGMRQRAMIAMALACRPKVLIADEPTTALDVTIQAQILDLIGELQREFGTAVILITHDLGVVAETAQRVVVMYAGRKVEEAPVAELFARPLHPYMRGLLGSIPRVGAAAAPSIRHSSRSGRTTSRPAGGRDMEPVIAVEGLKKHFPIRRGILRRLAGQVLAVDGVSFSIAEGETLGLVGESGCGKSTVGRVVLRLIDPTAGSVRLRGQEITRLGKRAMRPLRRQMQIVFQDPFASLNPRMRAGAIVGEPLRVHGVADAADRQERVAQLFRRVGLRPQQMRNYPHEFSGGQRQRISIARALALDPGFIVADEPVSALDVSIQAQVINLLTELQRELRLSYLFISHNLAVVEHISHRVAVMYLGRIVEHAERAELFARPLHPYTEALLAAVPLPDPGQKRAKLRVEGDVPSPIRPPPGCHFHPRCRYAEARCRVEVPELREVAPGHLVACHLR